MEIKGKGHYWNTEKQVEYQRKHCKVYSLKLNRNTDEELIEHLSKQPNVQGYIKGLIKADIEHIKSSEKISAILKDSRKEQ